MASGLRYEVWQANMRGGWTLEPRRAHRRRWAARLHALGIWLSYPRGSVYRLTEIRRGPSFRGAACRNP
jgi:hypothetical protein